MSSTELTDPEFAERLAWAERRRMGRRSFLGFTAAVGAALLTRPALAVPAPALWQPAAAVAEEAIGSQVRTFTIMVRILEDGAVQVSKDSRLNRDKGEAGDTVGFIAPGMVAPVPLATPGLFLEAGHSLAAKVPG